MYAEKYLRDVQADGPTMSPMAFCDLDRMPLDRPIEVQTGRSAAWRRVKWYPEGVAEVRGLPTLTGLWESREREGFYIEPAEVVAWRPICWSDE